MNSKNNIQNFSNLMKDFNLTLIKIISTASQTNDKIAINELGIDYELVKEISELNSSQQKSLSEHVCLISNLKVNNIALKLAIKNLIQ